MSSSSSGDSQVTGLAAQFGINLSTNQSEPQWVYPEIIKSRTLMKAMLKRKFDTEKYGPNISLLQILTNFNKSSKHDINALEVLAVDNFIGMISLSEDKKSAEVEISKTMALGETIILRGLMLENFSSTHVPNTKKPIMKTPYFYITTRTILLLLPYAIQH